MHVFTPVLSTTAGQLAQGEQEFGVDDRSAGGAANRVVGEHGKFPVERSAGAQAAR